MDSISYTESPTQPLYRHGNSDILPAWSQREAAAAEQPWTATRCHRQLRPLLAHLTALRREKAIAALKKKNDDSRHLPSAKKRLLCDTDPADRKRVRYTYSLKGTGRRRLGQPSASPSTLDDTPESAKSKAARHVQAKQQPKRSFSPGEIVLATPMLSRARKSQHTQSLASSPLANSTETTSAADADQLSGANLSNLSKPKADNTMSSRYGYYRRLPRLGSNGIVKTPDDEEWAILAKEAPAEYHSLHESVFRTFDSILRATADARETTGKRSSLLAMCLRKVPQFISMCEEAERNESEEKGAGSSSASLDIYNDLESLGRAGSGWKHLRAVVREHAVNLLKEACAEGLFHVAFIRLLARLCISMKAYAEAEALMAVLFDMHILAVPKGQRLFRQPYDATSGLPESTGASSSLSLLMQYSDETGQTSAPLRQLTSLLQGGHLPPAWLSTQAFSRVWQRVARLLSSRGTSPCDEAVLVDFMVSAMTKLVKSQPTDDICSRNLQDSPGVCEGTASPLSTSSSYHALVSILGTMCAICILQREALSEAGGADTVHTPSVAKRLSSVIHCCLAEVGRMPRRQKGRPAVASDAFLRPRCYLLELAPCVLSLGWASTGAEVCLAQDGKRSAGNYDFSKFANTDGVVKGQLYDVTVAFATSVAENCGRGAKSSILGALDTRDYLRNICQHFSETLVGVVNSESGKDLSQRLLADSAFLLASRSNDLRDLAFAESLGKSLKRTASHSSLSGPGANRSPMPMSSKTLATPLLKARTGTAMLPGLFEGYRWEEGISEWVISSPPASASSNPGCGTDKRQTRASNTGLDVLAVETGAYTPREQKAARLSSMKPDLLRTPIAYLTPSPSMRECSDSRSVFDDDESGGDDAGDADSEHATPSPELPARRISVERPRRTAYQSVASSDSDWMPETSRQSWSMRRTRASRTSRQESQRLRPRHSLLDVVSDDGVDDELEGGIHAGSKSITTARTPLLCIVGNARRSVGAGYLGQLGHLKHKETHEKHRGSGGVSASSSAAQTAGAAASSDDELGL